MENQPSVVLMLPLQEMALRRVAVILWNQTEILAVIEKFLLNSRGGRSDQESWQLEVENKVKDKLLKLTLPVMQRKKLMHLVRPIGLQILAWNSFHEEVLGEFEPFLQALVLKRLCWKSTGVIDYQKTAQKLIHDRIFDNMKCFRLACLNCLKCDFQVLWKELPEENKMLLEEKYQLQNVWVESLMFFSFYLEEVTHLLHVGQGRKYSINHMVFEAAALEGNRVLTEHFFQKLTHEEIESSLFKTARRVIECCNDVFNEDYSCNVQFKKYVDVFCYLFLQMNIAQKIEVIKRHPFKVLRCFAEWPWQDFFVNTAELSWPLLPKNDYNKLLVCLSRKRSECYNLNLFCTFFSLSPNDFRIYFIATQCEGMLIALFDEEDVEFIKFIFANLGAAEKLKIVFSVKWYLLCTRLMRKDKWHLLELFVQDSALSKEDKERLKDTFEKHDENFFRNDMEQEINKRKQFYEMLNNIEVRVSKKRSTLDEEISQAEKRQCLK